MAPGIIVRGFTAKGEAQKVNLDSMCLVRCFDPSMKKFPIGGRPCNPVAMFLTVQWTHLVSLQFHT